MAHKKAGGSTRNGRDSQAKRLGVKCFGGEAVVAGNIILRQRGTQRATLAQIAAASQCGSNTALEAVVTHSSEISPPPFMVDAAEVEVDLETGEAQVIRYEAAVDGGTP